MHIEVIADSHRLRRWQLWLVEALGKATACTVATRLVTGAPPLAPGLTTLLSFERLVGLARIESAADSIPASTWPTHSVETARPDLVIDLSGQARPPVSPGVRTLVPLFDGAPHEEAMWQALLDGRAPWLEIADSDRTSPVAVGLPALEAPHHVSQSADAVISRLIQAIERSARLIHQGGQPLETANGNRPRLAARAAPSPSAAAFAAGRIKSKSQEILQRLLRGGPRWSVAWRPSPERRRVCSETLRLEEFQRLADDGRRFYADPFVVFRDGVHHVFVEELPYATGRGIISHFSIGADGRASAVRPVLERPHHLSYPQVFEHDGSMWMLPEASQGGALELFRAERFPDRWRLEARIVEGHLHDATLLEHDARLWLFSESDYRQSSSWDGLSLYSAERITGPWTPHDLNPLLVDARAARPAGAMFRAGGEIWRPVQDCSQGYGSALGLARVTRLDAGGFSQDVVAKLAFDPRSGIRGPHTLNWDAGIEVIDLFAAG
ncbi:MAG: glucosamine inositolphosphorylceramide transferase family protein [Hyphomicrobium sp.]